MSGLILGALIFAFGLVTFTPRNSITLLILAFGLVIALHGAARIAAGLVMRGIKAEADRRDALPARALVAVPAIVPVATVSSTPDLSSTNVSASEPERLN